MKQGPPQKTHTHTHGPAKQIGYWKPPAVIIIITIIIIIRRRARDPPPPVTLLRRRPVSTSFVTYIITRVAKKDHRNSQKQVSHPVPTKGDNYM